jgi:hypothetical protein
MSKSSQEWKDIPDNFFQTWTDTFNQSRESINLTANCPICSSQNLRRYFLIISPKEKVIEGNRFVGQGELWEWCSNCRHYVHYTALIPDWWSCDLQIDAQSLTDTPETIERVISSISQ